MKAKAHVVVEGRHDSTNKIGDFRVFSGRENIKNGPRHSSDDDIGKAVKEPPMPPIQTGRGSSFGLRMSMRKSSMGANSLFKKTNKGNDENALKVTGKRIETFGVTKVKTKLGRKPLAELSNTRLPLKNQIIEGPKSMFGDVDTSNSPKGKTSRGSSYGRRVSLRKSSMAASASFKKTDKGIDEDAANVLQKRIDNSGVTEVKITGRKQLSEVSTSRLYLRNQPIEGSKSMFAKANKSNSPKSKIGRGSSFGLRVSMRKTSMGANVSLRKTGEGKTEAHIHQMACGSTKGSCKTVNPGELKNSVKTNDGKLTGKLSLATRKSTIVRRANHTFGTVKVGKFPGRKTSKLSTSVEFGTQSKVLEVNKVRNYQLRNRLLDGGKMIRDPIGKKNLSTSKIKGGLHISQPRHLLAGRKVGAVVNASLRTHASTIKKTAHLSTKIRGTSKSKPMLGLEKKSVADGVNSSMDNGGQVATKLICEDKSEKLTTVITKPRSGRRKSYTSWLMERSKIELPNIDDSRNHLEVVEYVDDIYLYYWTMEAQSPSLETYMASQTDITPNMRGILINWLIEVHLKFELMQETLFLMIQLLDRFLYTVPLKKDELQLVGLTTLLIASKYEDYWHPKIMDLISISSNFYTRDQVLAMEKLILKNLKFRLNYPTPYVFMLRFLKAAQSDEKLQHLAFYLIELCLVEYESLKYKPSLLCASAIYVARCTLKMAPTWTDLLVKHTHYEESPLKACAEMILRLHQFASKGSLRVTYEKYLSSDRGNVASIKSVTKLPL